VRLGRAASLGAFVVLLSCAVLVGCGGGGGMVSSTPIGASTQPPGAAASTGPTATPAPGTQSTVVPVATSSPYSIEEEFVVPVPASTDDGATPVPLVLPIAGGITTQVNLPPAGAEISGGTIVDAVVTNQDPSDVVGISSTKRVASGRSALSVGPIDVILYFGLAFTQTVVLHSYPSFEVLFPPGFLPSGAAYYLGLYDTSNPGAGWQFPWEGPAAIVSGNVLIFTGLSQPFTFKAGVRYYFELCVVSARATPSPRPSIPPPTPSPSPGASAAPGPLSVQPGIIAFSAPGQTATLAVSRSNFKGTFTATMSSPAIATVQAASASTFVVTAGATAGTSSVVVTDSSGGKVTVPLTVTITEGGIDSRGRLQH
jgi:hypothetical protein